MARPVIASPAPYATMSSLVLGREGMPASPVDSTNPLPVAAFPARRPVFRSGVTNFTPVAAATDIAYLRANSYGRTLALESVTITGKATAAGVLDVLVQRSFDGGVSAVTQQPTAKLDNRHAIANGAFMTIGANRTANGNGVNANRPLLAAGKLYLGTATVPGQPLTFRFEGPNRPTVRDLTEWLVINLNGQTIPAGCVLDIFAEWSEEAQAPVQFAGDSTTSNANFLFNELGNAGQLPAIANMFNAGSNGYRLEDALLNTNGVTYPLVGGNGVLNRLNAMPGVLVLCFGLNDRRQGGRTQLDLIAMLDAAIHATLNGTVSGSTYVSPMGSGMSFTWTATIPANPDCRIVLWGPNSLTTDGNGANFVTLTGIDAGKPIAQAAQDITDDLYFAYQAFAADPRVFALVQKQDLFGRTATTIANSGNAAFAKGHTPTAAPLMTDILHPNERGQRLSARQILPVVKEALAAVQPLIF